jgi:nucleoid-associated protein Lsr2
MAKTVTVNLIDDIDGSRAEETVSFGFDGASYEIDLGPENATKLRSVLAEWAQAGRPAEETEGRSGSGVVRLIRHSMDRTPGHVIRDWGRRNGHDVAERGRLPLHLVDAFGAAYHYQESPTGEDVTTMPVQTRTPPKA